MPAHHRRCHRAHRQRRRIHCQYTGIPEREERGLHSARVVPNMPAARAMHIGRYGYRIIADRVEEQGVGYGMAPKRLPEEMSGEIMGSHWSNVLLKNRASEVSTVPVITGHGPGRGFEGQRSLGLGLNGDFKGVTTIGFDAQHESALLLMVRCLVTGDQIGVKVMVCPSAERWSG